MLILPMNIEKCHVFLMYCIEVVAEMSKLSACYDTAMGTEGNVQSLFIIWVN